MPDTDNGRVTLAIIKSDIEHLTNLLESHIAEDKARRLDHETRIRDLESRTTTLESKQSALAVGQGIFTSIAATIAGWIGSQH